MDREAQAVNNVAVSSLEVMSKLLELIDSIKTNHTIYKESESKDEKKEEKKAIQILKHHVNNGGMLISDSLDINDAGIFRNLLKANNVTFIESNAIDKENDSERRVFLTKDTDKEIVDFIRKRFKYEMNIGLGELTIERFLEKNEGKTISTKGNLDRVEKEVFKHNMSDKDISFAINKNPKTGLYDIYYRKEEEESIDKAIRGMAYDLSGEEGAIFRSNIEDNLEKKDRFKEMLIPENSETVILADHYNAGEFIAIDKDGYSAHSLKKCKENGKSIIKDTKNKRIEGHNTIEEDIKTLRKPVILTLEEMEYIKGIDKDGNISYKNDPRVFKESFINTGKLISKKEPSYEDTQTLDNLKPTRSIIFYTGINYESQNEIRRLIDDGLLKNTTLIDNNLAFDSKEKDQIELILEKNEYSGLDEIERICKTWELEGHGALDINSLKTQYVINTKIPGYLFRLDKDAFTIINLKDSELNIKYERYSKSFNKNVENILEGIKYPVVLKEEELMLPNAQKQVIMHEREGKNVPGSMKMAIIDKVNKEKENYVEEGISMKITPRHKEADRLSTKWISKEYLVDRNLIEKITDHTTKPKKTTETKRSPSEEYGHEL